MPLTSRRKAFLPSSSLCKRSALIDNWKWNTKDGGFHLWNQQLIVLRISIEWTIGSYQSDSCQYSWAQLWFDKRPKALLSFSIPALQRLCAELSFGWRLASQNTVSTKPRASRFQACHGYKSVFNCLRKVEYRLIHAFRIYKYGTLNFLNLLGVLMNFTSNSLSFLSARI